MDTSSGTPGGGIPFLGVSMMSSVLQGGGESLFLLTSLDLGGGGVPSLGVAEPTGWVALLLGGVEAGLKFGWMWAILGGIAKALPSMLGKDDVLRALDEGVDRGPATLVSNRGLITPLPLTSAEGGVFSLPLSAPDTCRRAEGTPPPFPVGGLW